MPQEKEATGIEGAIEMVHRGFARGIVEVDQHIAAEDEVEGAHLAHLRTIIQVQALNGDHGSRTLRHQKEGI
jgi:hypothetical protein